MKLHFDTCAPARRAARLHADDCQHAHLISHHGVVEEVQGMDDVAVIDLEQRGFPVRLAPCLKKETT